MTQSIYPRPTIERSRVHRGNYAVRSIYSRGDTFDNAGVRYLVDSGHFVAGAAGATFAQELAAGRFIVDPSPPTGAQVPTPNAADANKYLRVNGTGSALTYVTDISHTFAPWPATTAVAANEFRRAPSGAVIYSPTARTTGATFTAAEAGNWTFVAGTNGAWVANQVVFANEIRRTATGHFIRSNTTRQTTATYNAAEAANWSYLAGTTGDWAAATVVHANEVRRAPSGNLIRSNSTRQTGAAFDAAEQANWTTLSAAGGGAPWAANTAVQANELRRAPTGVVIYSPTARTTGAAFDAAEAGNWTFAGGPITDWAATTVVMANEVRRSPAGDLIRSNTTRQTTATYNAAEAANWTALSVSATTAAPWAASTAVAANELRRAPTGVVIYSPTARTTGAAFDAAEAANWTYAGGPTADWAATTVVMANELRRSPTGQLIRSNTTRQTTAAYNAAEAGNWTTLSGVRALDWPAATLVEAQELRVNAGRLYRSNSARTTGAAFDAAEAANWTRIGAHTPMRAGLHDARGFRASAGVTANVITFAWQSMPFITTTGEVLWVGTLAGQNFTPSVITAANTWFNVFAFADPLGGGIEFRDEAAPANNTSVVNTKTLLPATAVAGKPYTAYVGSYIWTVAATTLRRIDHFNQHASCATVDLYNTTTPHANNTPTTLNISNAVPPWAHAVTGGGQFRSGGGAAIFSIGTFLWPVGARNICGGSLFPTSTMAGDFTVPCDTQRVVISRVEQAAVPSWNAYIIFCSGWEV